MGIISKIFGAVSKQEMDGAHIDLNQPFWEVEGETDFPKLFSALEMIVPENSVLYFEGGSQNKLLIEFFDKHAIPEQLHMAFGTIWPRPDVYHIPTTQENFSELIKISERCAYPELAIHFHVYHENEVLLEWHDAFIQPMLLAGTIEEEKVKSLAKTLSMKYSRWKNSVEQINSADAKSRGAD